MKAIIVYLHQFNELDNKAKEVAREWFRKDYPDYDWWNGVYENAKEAAKYFGVEIDKICFSGFWSQGDGACFTGVFRSGDISSLGQFKEDHPNLEKLHALLQRLLALKHPEGAELKITASGFYSHSGNMNFDDADYAYSADDFEELVTCLRSFADWIYAQLEQEYEYLMSDECVDDNIISNEYWFLAGGTRCTLGDD